MSDAHTAAAHRPMTRVTLAQKLSVACPQCGERAGMFCRRTLLDGGDCIADRCHPKRREAYLREQAEAAELAAYRAQQLGDVRVTFPFSVCPLRVRHRRPRPGQRFNAKIERGDMSENL